MPCRIVALLSIVNGPHTHSHTCQLALSAYRGFRLLTRSGAWEGDGVLTEQACHCCPRGCWHSEGSMHEEAFRKNLPGGQNRSRGVPVRSGGSLAGMSSSK
eukprot:908633-Pyramimonas_sp.AAC.2